VRIPTTPAMRRFNAAVERADAILGPHWDRAPQDRLISALVVEWGKGLDGALDAAGELEQSWKAITKCKQ
jgi:hypothetical protein